MSVAESPSSGMGGGGGVKIRSFYSAVTSAGNEQNMKPVQIAEVSYFAHFTRLCAFISNLLLSYFVGSLYFQRFCLI